MSSPSALARAATSLAIEPNPISPNRLPDISRPIRSVRGHSPAIMRSIAFHAPRKRTSAAVIVYSATATSFAPVAGQTTTLRDLQASRSILSSPTPKRPTTWRFGACSRSSLLTCVRLRTMMARASARFSSNAMRSSTRVGLYCISRLPSTSNAISLSMNSEITMSGNLRSEIDNGSNLSMKSRQN